MRHFPMYPFTDLLSLLCGECMSKFIILVALFSCTIDYSFELLYLFVLFAGAVPSTVGVAAAAAAANHRLSRCRFSMC